MKFVRIMALVFALALVSACTPKGSETQVPTTAVEVQPTKAVAQVVEPAAEPQQDNCVDCHTDKNQLIDTAKPEEVVEEESEGAG